MFPGRYSIKQCDVRNMWVHAMNTQPTYTNLKNIFTPEFRKRLMEEKLHTASSLYAYNYGYSANTAFEQKKHRMCHESY